MTTMTPDKQPAAETLEEIATKVVNQIAVGAWQYCSRQWVIGLVTEALRNERERCAKVADIKAAYHVLRHAEFLSGHARVAAGHSGSKAEACSEVASAIREGK